MFSTSHDLVHFYIFLVLEAGIAPEFVVEPKSCSVREGQKTEFVCKVQGRPDPSVTWQMNGHDITETSIKHKISERSGLKVSEIN